MTMTPPAPDDTARVLLYLGKERSAAISKIAFDLKLDVTDAATIVHTLRERGLVREAGGGGMTKMAQTAAASLPAYYILSESGLEETRLLQSRSTWVS
jgi:DNA-binding IclR family transcriptional regulator